MGKKHKGPDLRVTSNRDRAEEGNLAVGTYRQRYQAAAAIAQRVQRHALAGTPLHEIAVLAPRWNQLEDVEHALRELGLPVQRYDCDDGLRPVNSALGRHLLRQLLETLTTVSEYAVATLQLLNAPYSTGDQSFAALVYAVGGLKGASYETLALKLEGARPLATSRVVLSSYHSAKGSEFDVVFVMDDRQPEPGEQAFRRAPKELERDGDDQTRARVISFTCCGITRPAIRR